MQLTTCNRQQTATDSNVKPCNRQHAIDNGRVHAIDNMHEHTDTFCCVHAPLLCKHSSDRCKCSCEHAHTSPLISAHPVAQALSWTRTSTSRAWWLPTATNSAQFCHVSAVATHIKLATVRAVVRVLVAEQSVRLNNKTCIPHNHNKPHYTQTIISKYTL